MMPKSFIENTKIWTKFLPSSGYKNDVSRGRQEIPQKYGVFLSEHPLQAPYPRIP
jgi:hypothetical protein